MTQQLGGVTALAEEDLDLVSGNSQPPITPAPKGPMPSLCLWEHLHACDAHKFTQAKHI